MKASKITLMIAMLVAPAISFAQSQDAYKKKTYKKTTVMDTSKRTDPRKDPVIKESAPVLDDKGALNTNGTVDGSRSSTGRPGVDTTAGYTRKRKRTITSSGVVYPDTAAGKNPKP